MEQRVEKIEKDIKEATGLFIDHLKVYAENGKELAGLKEQVSGMRTDIGKLDKSLESKYVTKDQFLPVKNLVYGVVALILTSVVTAGLTFVIIEKTSSSDAEAIARAVTQAIDAYNLTLTE